MVIFSHAEVTIVILSPINSKTVVTRNADEGSVVLNRPVTIVVGCADPTFSYISREVIVRSWRMFSAEA